MFLVLGLKWISVVMRTRSNPLRRWSSSRRPAVVEIHFNSHQVLHAFYYGKKRKATSMKTKHGKQWSARPRVVKAVSPWVRHQDGLGHSWFTRAYSARSSWRCRPMGSGFANATRGGPSRVILLALLASAWCVLCRHRLAAACGLRLKGHAKAIDVAKLHLVNCKKLSAEIE